MTETLTPLKNRILIEPPPPRERVMSIFLPEMNQKIPLEGTIVTVGPEVREVKPGEYVYYASYNPLQIRLNGRLYILIAESEVLAVDEEKTAE